MSLPRENLKSRKQFSLVILTALVLISFPFAIGMLDRYMEEVKSLETVEVFIEMVTFENVTDSFRMEISFQVLNPSRSQMNPFAMSYSLFLNGEMIGSNGSTLYQGIPPNGSIVVKVVHSVFKRVETQRQVSTIVNAAKTDSWFWYVSGSFSFRTLIPPGTAVIFFACTFSGVQSFLPNRPYAPFA